MLKMIREMIYGSIDSQPLPELSRTQICHELQKTDLLLILIQHLPNIGFDGRKDIGLIYEYVIEQQIGTRFPIVQYILSKPTIIKLLMEYSVDQSLSQFVVK